jgi:atlastin
MAAFETATALQIVSTGEGAAETANDFLLSEVNIESIISKIPPKAKVAVVSIVGAFRTGKSFLLNFMLRYLRHAKYGELSDDWMTADGGDLLDGNGNDLKKEGGEATDSKGCSFVWKAGSQRQTTGIWMWSEPFMKVMTSSCNFVAIFPCLYFVRAAFSPHSIHHSSLIINLSSLTTSAARAPEMTSRFS